MHANLGPVRPQRLYMTYVPDGGGPSPGHQLSTSWKIFFRYCEFLFCRFAFRLSDSALSKFLDHKPWSEYAYFRS